MQTIAKIPNGPKPRKRLANRSSHSDMAISLCIPDNIDGEDALRLTLGFEDSLEALSPDKTHGIRHSTTAAARPAAFFFHFVAFARSQKQVFFQSMLTRIEIVIAALKCQQLSVLAALQDFARFDHKNLVGLPDC